MSFLEAGQDFHQRACGGTPPPPLLLLPYPSRGRGFCPHPGRGPVTLARETSVRPGRLRAEQGYGVKMLCLPEAGGCVQTETQHP